MRVVWKVSVGLFLAASLGACSTDEEAMKPEPTAKPVVQKVVPKPLPKVEEQPAVPSNPDGNYREQAEALVAAIDGGKDAAEIGQLADKLTKTGLAMLPALIEKHAECKAYLDAIIAVGDKLKDMPLDEIEAGYHADGKLPETPSAECYHGKDLVVHPATVVALVNAGLTDREQAKAEITEVLGHLGAVEADAKSE